MTKRYLLLLLIVLSVTTVLAADYEVDVIPKDTTILPNESASYQFLVNNFDNTAERFQIYTLDTNYVLRIEPPIGVVQPNSRSEHMIYVRPKSNVGFGSQGLTILIKNLNENIIQQESVILHITDPLARGREYAPSVQLTVGTPETSNPRDPLRVSVHMRNRNNLDIRNMTVEVTSDLFSKMYTTTLGRVAEREDEITFSLSPYQSPGTYEMRVKLTYQDQVISEHISSLIIARVNDVQETVEDDSALFTHTAQLHVTNNGNLYSEHQARMETNWFRSIFTSTEPKAQKTKIAGERYLVWDLGLSPQETQTVSAKTNYRLLVVLIVLAILGVIFYFVMRSPLIAVKETISLGSEKDSSNLKVRIFLKNRTGKPLDAVTVIDRVPGIATYVKKETLGVISPTKILTQPKKGTVLKWELDVLEPFEERILSYELASKLHIVGQIKLPAAKVHFTGLGGKERIIFTQTMAFEE